MSLKPSLLSVTATVAAITMATSTISGVAAAADQAAPKKPPVTRLGSAIENDLAQRDEADAARQRKMDLQEQALQASQKRLDADLQEEEDSSETGSDKNSTKRGEKTGAVEDDTADQLARIYQGMKAKKAAPVFEKLDLELQIAIARKMRERNTGLILAEMSPNAAARLSMALAGRKASQTK